MFPNNVGWFSQIKTNKKHSRSHLQTVRPPERRKNSWLGVTGIIWCHSSKPLTSSVLGMSWRFWRQILAWRQTLSAAFPLISGQITEIAFIFSFRFWDCERVTYLGACEFIQLSVWPTTLHNYAFGRNREFSIQPISEQQSDTPPMTCRRHLGVLTCV